jgi:hypothetical protein
MSATAALSVLARVARKELDEQRRLLLATNRKIATLHDELAALRAAAERERLAARVLAEQNARLLAHLRRGDGRANDIAAELPPGAPTRRAGSAPEGAPSRA